MYKVLFLVDKEVDPTIYNFKDLTIGEGFRTYLTNDFHDEGACKTIINDFVTKCTEENIKVLDLYVINKEFINKHFAQSTTESKVTSP